MSSEIVSFTHMVGIFNIGKGFQFGEFVKTLFPAVSHRYEMPIKLRTSYISDFPDPVELSSSKRNNASSPNL